MTGSDYKPASVDASASESEMEPADQCLPRDDGSDGVSLISLDVAADSCKGSNVAPGLHVNATAFFVPSPSNIIVSSTRDTKITTNTVSIEFLVTVSAPSQWVVYPVSEQLCCPSSVIASDISIFMQ